MKKSPAVVFAAALMFTAGLVHAREQIKESGNQSIEVIDMPTAGVVDHYGYNIGFRFGSEGALQNKTIFGVFPRLNLGFGLDGEHVLGTGDMRFNKPTINLKLRAFDGQGVIPALAIGYDGQGYVYNRNKGEYEQRQPGFYLVGSWNPFTPDFQWNLGVNVFDFDTGDTTRGFTSVTYTYQKLVGLMFEWVNFNDYKDRRLNFGAKIYITPVFTVDLIGRDIPLSYRNENRDTERIVKLSYTGSF